MSSPITPLHAKIVKDSINIVDVVERDVPLKRYGSTLKGLCPFHNEHSPSFTVNRAGGYYKCFGCGKGGDMIDFYREMHNKSFPEAVKEIAQAFNIDLQLENPDYVKNKIRSTYSNVKFDKKKHKEGYSHSPVRPLSPLELRNLFAKGVWAYLGEKYKHLGEECEAAVIKHLHKVCEDYHFWAIDWYEKADKELKFVSRYESNEFYPMFIYDETHDGEPWQKLYQPYYQKVADQDGKLGPDFRFIYMGKKPAKFIHGASLVEAKYETENEMFFDWHEENGTLVKVLDEDTGEEVKVVRAKRKKHEGPTQFFHNEIVMVSGGSDGLNLAALGYMAVWTNSESEIISKKEYKALKQYAHKFYVLNDADATGIAQTHKYGLTHMEAFLVYLPESLREKRDYLKNKPCKDVKDYLNHYDFKALRNLFKSALPYQFWEVIPQYSKDGEKLMKDGQQVLKFTISITTLLHFLGKMGFYIYREALDDEKFEESFIRLENNVVSKIEAGDVRRFVNNFLATGNQGEALPTALRDYVTNCKQITAESLKQLPVYEPDFVDATANKQIYFFLNDKGEVAPWVINPQRITDVSDRNHQKEISSEELASLKRKQVWKHEIRNYKVKLLDPAFTATENADNTWKIDINHEDGFFWKYLIATTRIHWTVEEIGVEETDENGKKYIRKTLNEAEIADHNQALANRLFCLGYALHKFKDPSRPWMQYILEYAVNDEGQAQGGSGKSILSKVVTFFMKSIFKDGRDPKIEEDSHGLGNVTKQTKALRIEDIGPNFNLEAYLNKTSEGLTANPKGLTARHYEYKDSPKISFTSNYIPKQLNDSLMRRLLFNVFSDYFHFGSTSGDHTYTESRSPKSEYGINLFDDFDQAEWNLCINVCMQALKFYLNCEDKIDPPMKGVQERYNNRLMGEEFEQWAQEYFVDGNRLDTYVDRKNAQWEYNTGKKGREIITPNLFKKKLRAFCDKNHWILDPLELRNSSDKKHISMRPDALFVDLSKGKQEGVDVTRTTRVMFYIKTGMDTSKYQREAEPTVANLTKGIGTEDVEF